VAYKTEEILRMFNEESGQFSEIWRGHKRKKPTCDQQLKHGRTHETVRLPKREKK